MRRILTAAALLLAASLLVSSLPGCGLKGDLVLPDSAEAGEEADSPEDERDDE